jgi:hypothetical protein
MQWFLNEENIARIGLKLVYFFIYSPLNFQYIIFYNLKFLSYLAFWFNLLIFKMIQINIWHWRSFLRLKSWCSTNNIKLWLLLNFFRNQRLLRWSFFLWVLVRWINTIDTLNFLLFYLMIWLNRINVSIKIRVKHQKILNN